jgi:hypothetical protein
VALALSPPLFSTFGAFPRCQSSVPLPPPAWRGANQTKPPFVVDQAASVTLFGNHPPTVTVLPFDPDPRLLGAFLALAVTAAAVVMGLALRRFLSRWLPEDDPRRQLIAQKRCSTQIWARSPGRTLQFFGVCDGPPGDEGDPRDWLR